MPKQIPYPSGPIAVEDARLKDISAGMDWNMQDASDVRFLVVSGTLWVGNCRTTYDFTLVEYHLYIDEVSWTIFLPSIMPLSKSLRQSAGILSTTAGKSGGDSWRYPGMGKPMKSLHRILKFVYPFSMTSPTP